MIVILYDYECSHICNIAQLIKNGVESENEVCPLMNLRNIDFEKLQSANGIIFGCCAGFFSGISEKMMNFMNSTVDRFENQNWKNKCAAGFTSNIESDATKVIDTFINFSARQSMIWIPQGHIAENEASGTRGINKNKSYLGCISGENDTTPFFFGKRIAQQSRRFRHV